MNRNCFHQKEPVRDPGPKPLIIDLETAVCQNTNFRTALWTGANLQLTAMCIPVGGEIGVEMHEDVDQLIGIENGCALVMMGCSQNRMDMQKRAGHRCTVIIPAGTWHNIRNIGNTPLKVYSVYAPPNHPFGTIHRRKSDAEQAY